MARIAAKEPHEVFPTQTAARSPPSQRPPTQVLQSEADSRFSLLFVDGYNRTRSVLAQASAEILRLWTLNDGRQCPFSRLDSAGLYLESSLVTTGEQPDEEPDKDGLNALFRGRTSAEEQDVRRRLLTRQPRGITAKDFAAYDYILAFDKRGFNRLSDLRQLVIVEAGMNNDPMPTAKIMLLGAGVSSPRPSSIRGRSRLAEADYAGTIEGIRNELERFMVRKVGWTRPGVALDAVGAPFKSRQFVALARRLQSNTVIKHVSEVCACRLSIDRNTAGETECVVIVTAKAADLEDAFETSLIRFAESG